MVQNLTTFLEQLAECGELRRVTAEVDPELEIAAVTTRVCRQPGGGPALLFERVKGHRFAVATNLFGSRARAARAWGVPDMDAARERLRRELAAVAGETAALRLQTVLAHHPAPVAPTAPALNAVAADLSLLPALKNWPGDGGRFLSLPLVITRHPETAAVNIGIYRMQLLDGRRAALHFLPGADGGRHLEAWRQRGEPMPVAVVLGGDPALIAAAALPLPAGVGEADFAGLIRGASINLGTAPGTGLPVPLAGEFLLEGSVAPEEMAWEGPFGNHTGFYRPLAPAAVFRLAALHARPGAILPATVVGPPPTENLFLGKANERLILALLQSDYPEIADLSYFAEGIFHGCAVLALNREVSRPIAELVRQLWGEGPLRRSRLLVLVDEADWPAQPQSLFWQVVNRADPGRDVILDGSRMAVDATEKTGWARVEDDPRMAAHLEGRWQELGLA